MSFSVMDFFFAHFHHLVEASESLRKAIKSIDRDGFRSYLQEPNSFNSPRLTQLWFEVCRAQYEADSALKGFFIEATAIAYVRVDVFNQQAFVFAVSGMLDRRVTIADRVFSFSVAPKSDVRIVEEVSSGLREDNLQVNSFIESRFLPALALGGGISLIAFDTYALSERYSKMHRFNACLVPTQPQRHFAI